MNQQDSLQSFLIENADIRGKIVRLQETYAEILAENYPETIQKLLGETLLSVVLLAASIKFKGSLTIQFHGEGPIRLLVASCNEKLQVRGLAKFAENTLDHEFSTAFKQGKLVITILTENSPKPYQSLLAIDGQSIQECLENYFSQSEQLLTKFRLAVNRQQAVGISLQLLPAQTMPMADEFLALATKINKPALSDEELLQYQDNVQLLQQLYEEQDIRLFAAQPVEFKCSCNVEKMKQAIKVMGEQEAFSLLSTHKTIDVQCEFCNKSHQFDKLEVMAIFNSSSK